MPHRYTVPQVREVQPPVPQSGTANGEVSRPPSQQRDLVLASLMMRRELPASFAKKT
jgi:hypothetical protein